MQGTVGATEGGRAGRGRCVGEEVRKALPGERIQNADVDEVRDGIQRREHRRGREEGAPLALRPRGRSQGSPRAPLPVGRVTPEALGLRCCVRNRKWGQGQEQDD